MKTKRSTQDITPDQRFIPHEASIKRVKDSFERSKNKQREDRPFFVEIK